MGEGHAGKSLKYFVARYLLRRKFLVAGAERYSLRFRFRVEDAIGRSIYKQGVYEPEITEYILGNIHLGNGGVFIDAGANIGWYSLLLSRGGERDIAVYAFEPDPLNYRILTENVGLNNASNVTAIQKALSDAEETKTLYLYPNKNRGRHSLLPINEGPTVQVQTTTLDSFIRGQGISPEKVSFVKIDVEGYELSVLKGAATLLGTVPVFLCEYSPVYMKKCGVDPRGLIDLFTLHRYAAHELRDGSLHALDASELDSIKSDGRNIFWIRR